MEDLAELMGVVMVHKGIEKGTNQIKFDNFVIRGQEKKILKFKTTCPLTSQKRGEEYLDLYRYLMKKDIITSKIGGISVITLDTINNINQTKLVSLDQFKLLLNDYSTALPCYELDKIGLFNLLKNYQYEMEDEVKLLRNIIRNKSRTKSKRKSKSKTKSKRR
jgi:hypothetical protein